jgi:hypothetical protein
VPVDDRPESRAVHGLAGGASSTVLEQGAGHIEAVLLLRELDQLAVYDLLPRASIGCGQESADLAQREADVVRLLADDDIDASALTGSLTSVVRATEPGGERVLMLQQRGILVELLGTHGRRGTGPREVPTITSEAAVFRSDKCHNRPSPVVKGGETRLRDRRNG